MVSTNAVLLASTAVEKSETPSTSNGYSMVGQKTARVKTLTPPIKTSAFTSFFLAVETNLSRSSSPKIENSSSEGVVSLGGQRVNSNALREN